MTRSSSDGRCPMCRTAYDSHLIIPDPRIDPEGWFKLIDWDNSCELDPEEVTDGLKATVDLDFRRVEADIQSLWSRWDHDGNGSISLNEFKTGLLPYILENYPGAERPIPHLETEVPSAFEFYDIVAARENGAVPDISTKPRLWFQYWDEDDGGTLDKYEVLRAVIKTFRICDTAANTGHIFELLDAVWPIFDHDESGEIDLDEFTTADGLCDTLLATIQFRTGTGSGGS